MEYGQWHSGDMTGGIEIAGDLVTGGLIARAVEPVAGENTVDGQAKCLNCGEMVIGRYCHYCGQPIRVHRTLLAFWHDLLHAVFHFDGKFFRTIPLLVWKPGDLTRRYIHGERAKFVSPLALFLFSVFLMFAAFSWVGSPFQPQAKTYRNGVAQSKEQLKAELAEANITLAKLKTDRAEAVSKGTSVVGIDAKIESVDADISGLKTGVKLANGVEVKDLVSSDSLSDLKIDTKIDTGIKSIDEKIKHAIANPQLLLYKLQSSAYKFSWALIPLSVPFLWLMFAWRREFKVYDHAVFVTYSLSFMSLLLIVLSVMNAMSFPGSIPEVALVLVPPFHIFRQLKSAYGLSLKGALVRTFLLLIGGSFVLVFFVMILLALGVMG